MIGSPLRFSSSILSTTFCSSACSSSSIQSSLYVSGVQRSMGWKLSAVAPTSLTHCTMSGKYLVVLLADRRLDDDREVEPAFVSLFAHVLDSVAELLEQPRPPAQIVVQLGVRGINRNVQVPRVALDQFDRVLAVERRAVRCHSGVNPVLMAKRHQIDEPRLDEWLAAAEADRVRAHEVLDAQQGRLPLLDRHLVAILR